MSTKGGCSPGGGPPIQPLNFEFRLRSGLRWPSLLQQQTALARSMTASSTEITHTRISIMGAGTDHYSATPSDFATETTLCARVLPEESGYVGILET